MSLPGEVRFGEHAQERARGRAPGYCKRRAVLAGMSCAKLVGDQFGQLAHQRVPVRIRLPRHLDHAAISRQRCPSVPVSL